MASSQRRGVLYVAGSSSAVPRPGRANSGYLLRAEGCAVALDFGNGALSRLRQRIEPSRLDAVVVSHMHADHFFDLVPLRYALKYETPRTSALPVYVPPGGVAVLQAIGKPLKEDADFYEGVLDLREYVPGAPLGIGACTIAFAPALHYIPAYAMRVEIGGAVVGYSGDTAPCAAVAELMKGADVFLCECALGSHGSEQGKRGHSNAAQAGEMAQQAGVGHLVLTHYDANAQPLALQQAAARCFDGTITVADDGMELAL